MDDDAILFDWIRHYLSLIALCVLVGIAGGLAYAVLSPARFEAWSIIVQTRGRISPLQLGPIAQAVFRTESVYGPAMRELGIREPPEEFLDRRAEVRPVPETDALIVIGRSEDAEEAARISDAMMRSLIRVFEERELTEFGLFERAAPVEPDLAASVLVALGGASGLWVGVAVGLLHYRIRRPLLTLQRAVRMTDASSVVTVKGTGPAWLGVLRRRRGWRDIPANRAALARLATRWPAGARPFVAVADGGREDALRRRLHDAVGLPNGDGPSAGFGPGVIVAHAGSREVSLAQARRLTGPSKGEGPGIDLVWVR